SISRSRSAVVFSTSDFHQSTLAPTIAPTITPNKAMSAGATGLCVQERLCVRSTASGLIVFTTSIWWRLEPPLSVYPVRYKYFTRREIRSFHVDMNQGQKTFHYAV